MAAFDCLDKYRWCLRGFRRTFLHAMVSYVREAIRTNFCAEDVRSMMFSMSRCLEPVHLAPMRECWAKLLSMNVYARDNMTSLEKFAGHCCAFNHFMDCATEYSRSVSL